VVCPLKRSATHWLPAACAVCWISAPVASRSGAHRMSSPRRTVPAVERKTLLALAHRLRATCPTEVGAIPPTPRSRPAVARPRPARRVRTAGCRSMPAVARGLRLSGLEGGVRDPRRCCSRLPQWRGPAPVVRRGRDPPTLPTPKVAPRFEVKRSLL
jgi:hypothetical protein